MKKQILLIAQLMSMVGTEAYAKDIEVKNDDGVTIYYNYINNGTELEVTNFGSQSYRGDVVIPEEVTYMNRKRKVTAIGYRAFEGCSSLTSVTIPNSVTSIGEQAFWCCSGLTSVTIPNSVTSIGSSAFMNCSSLTSVTIGNSVTSIGDGAFYNCSSLTSVTIPNSVTSFGIKAFMNCSSLTSVTIGNSVTSIGEQAFWCCSSLTSVTIPNSVTSIGVQAFYECSGLTSITIPNSVTSIGIGAFYECTSLTSITIPNSVTSIESSAFSGCSGLISVSIPNSVTNIGPSAFSGCSGLTSITIPNSVTSIGGRAFYCSNLTEVISLIKEPFAIKGKYYDHRTFTLDVFNNATLYVPVGTKEKYKATEGWKDFLFIEEGTGSGGETPDTHKCATPTISYFGKRLTFSCETEDVQYVYNIKDADIKQGYDSEVQLTATYEISVYATKAGYENSDLATALLVWNTATFTETTQEQSALPSVTIDNPALITARGGIITVSTEANGLPISVYTTDGKQSGSATVSNGQATIPTNLPSGSIAIIKLGQQAVKVVMR